MPQEKARFWARLALHSCLGLMLIIFLGGRNVQLIPFLKLAAIMFVAIQVISLAMVVHRSQNPESSSKSCSYFSHTLSSPIHSKDGVSFYHVLRGLSLQNFSQRVVEGFYAFDISLGIKA